MTAADAAPSKAAFTIEDTMEEETIEGTLPAELEDDDTMVGDEPPMEPEV